MRRRKGCFIICSSQEATDVGEKLIEKSAWGLKVAREVLQMSTRGIVKK